jgi:CheY-like chemotaxis protein
MVRLRREEGAVMIAKRVLVADDYEQARSLLCRILEKIGVRAIGVRNGCEAFFLAVTDPPDLILLDVNMPCMDGYEVLDRIKRHPSTCEIPVMIISGLDWSYERKLAMSLGAHDYLPKPVLISDLHEKVLSALR